MHKFIQWIFASLINIEKFLRIVCVFFIMMLALYWIQNTTNSSWGWFSFFVPVLDSFLNTLDSISLFSFNFIGTANDAKYFNALFYIVAFILGLNLINHCLEKLLDLYEDAHFVCKKTTEKIFNNNLENQVKQKEKQINDYKLFIQTRITKRYANKQNSISLDEYSAKINKMIEEKTKATPFSTWGGVVYSFNNFEKIDIVLDILFELIKTPVPIEYLICIQIENNDKQLKQLIELQEWGKIIISADTLCRYKYNKKRSYHTLSVGIYQKENHLLEVHEFVEKL